MDDLEIKIAEIAHDCWRLIQARDREYSGLAAIAQHPASDADVPFNQLSFIDHDTAVLSIRHQGITELLAALIEYPRGTNRPITAPEARYGIEVQLIDQPEIPGTICAFEIGEFDWQTSSITVSWADGANTTHITEERELCRI